MFYVSDLPAVKPKPGLLRETLKKLIIPIEPNIVFTRELDKAWIIIDTVPFNNPCPNCKLNQGKPQIWSLNCQALVGP